MAGPVSMAVKLDIVNYYYYYYYYYYYHFH